MLIAKSRPDFRLVCIVQQLMAAHTSQVYSALRITNFAVTEKDGREWTRMPVRFSSHPSLRLMCDEIWQLWNVILDFKANFSMYNHVWRKCKKNKKKKLYFPHPIPFFFFCLTAFFQDSVSLKRMHCKATEGPLCELSSAEQTDSLHYIQNAEHFFSALPPCQPNFT